MNIYVYTHWLLNIYSLSEKHFLCFSILLAYSVVKMTASTDNDSKAHSRKGNTNINNIFVDTSGRNSSVESTKSRNKKQISALLIWPTVVILYTVTFVFLHEVKYNKYPEPKYSAIYAEKGQFFEDEARRHLLKLCSFGPKPAGSNANEVQTVQYIVNQIDIIRESNQEHSPVNSLTIDIQKVSGSFLLKNFVQTNYYSVYENLQNVVVLLEPPNTSKSSLLINCHFDSVVDSPGNITVITRPGVIKTVTSNYICN